MVGGLLQELKKEIPIVSSYNFNVGRRFEKGKD